MATYDRCTQCQRLIRLPAGLYRLPPGGRCPQCQATPYTVPADEWDEMTPAERRAAKGIYPEQEVLSEDERQDRRDRSSQYDGPSG